LSKYDPSVEKTMGTMQSRCACNEFASRLTPAGPFDIVSPHESTFPIRPSPNPMTGAFLSFAAAVAWAGSSTILKFLAAAGNALVINMLRLWTGSCLLAAYVLLTGKGEELLRIPLSQAACLLLSGITGMALGDTLYIRCLRYMDVSRAFPIAQSSFPLLTMVVAAVFLGESLTWVTVGGGCLVVLGVCLIAGAGKKMPGVPGVPDTTGRGVTLALLAATAWTAATAALKIGAAHMDPFVAAAVRIPAAAVVLSLPALRGIRAKQGLGCLGVRNLVLILTAGLLTYGIAAVCYVAAMQRIGAAKTVLLTTTAPLFVLPFSILILKERPSPHTVVGILLSVVGIAFVVT